MTSTGLETAISAIKPLQRYTLIRPAAGIGLRWLAVVKSDEKQMFPLAVSFACQACCPVPLQSCNHQHANIYTNNR